MATSAIGTLGMFSIRLPHKDAYLRACLHCLWALKHVRNLLRKTLLQLWGVAIVHLSCSILERCGLESCTHWIFNSHHPLGSGICRVPVLCYANGVCEDVSRGMFAMHWQGQHMHQCIDLEILWLDPSSEGCWKRTVGPQEMHPIWV